jgi:hypothetical protein
MVFIHQLDTYACGFATDKLAGRAGAPILEQHRIGAGQLLDLLAHMFEMQGMSDCQEACVAALAEFRNPLDTSAAHSYLHAFKRAILTNFEKRNFLHVRQDRCDLLDKDTLFGEVVNEQFPSAARDIREAGNCLAAECGTAAVFHLMRAAEFSLRALAVDRNVIFKDKPLEEKEWGQILTSLETRATELRNAARTSWPSPEIRDAQIRFYNEVIQELRGFNDAWRRHVSHADAAAFYDRNTAMGIFEHVRLFMQKISGKISETYVTDKYWVSLYKHVVNT